MKKRKTEGRKERRKEGRTTNEGKRERRERKERGKQDMAGVDSTRRNCSEFWYFLTKDGKVSSTRLSPTESRSLVWVNVKT
jgi:hypothetical protein